MGISGKTKQSFSLEHLTSLKPKYYFKSSLKFNLV
jgi:hypothetical protein